MNYNFKNIKIPICVTTCVYIGRHRGVAHATAITDVQTDVHIVPVDCDITDHNLLILPTPDVALVL